MSLIATMREKKAEPVVGYIDFLQSYSKKRKFLYCFFEGKDDEVYYSRIIQLTLPATFDFETFTCKNKDGVLKIYKLIKNKKKYKKAKTGFFIDRDFDRLKRNPDIFETPFYSIENFYVGIETVKKIFYEQFRISKTSPDFKLCLDLYINLQSDFHNKVLNVNSWLACYADVRNKRDSSVPRLNINDKLSFINKVDSNLTNVNITKLSFNEIMCLFNCPAELITKREYKKKKKKFSACKKSEVFRGKFEIQFFVSFLNKLKDVIGNRNQTLCSKQYKKITLQLNETNVFTQLNSYAHVPNSLRKYIKNIAA